MRHFGVVACAMLYTLSTFLMLGKNDMLGKDACLLIVLSGFVFVLVDMLLSFLKKSNWLDHYARYRNWLRILVFLIALGFLVVELTLLGYGSAFMITMTTLAKTPTVLLASAILLVALYMAMLKEDRLQSLSALLGWLFLLGFGFLFLIGWQMAHHTVLPFQPLSYARLNQGIWFYVISLFIHIAVLNSLSDIKDRKFIHAGVILASVIYGVVYFGNMYLLHHNLVSQFHFPTITSSSLMSYGHFLQRLELIAVVAILTSDVLKIAVLLRFLYRLARVFMSQIMTRCLLGVCCIAVAAIGYFWFPSYDAWYAMSTTILLIFGSGCLLLWIVA